MTPESELISVQAAAAALGVSERYVRRLASQGRVQGAKKIGRDWLIPSPPWSYGWQIRRDEQLD